MIELLSKGRQRGQSIIEFAVIVPFFLTFMLSVIYGGMMISDYLALKHVAGTAARVATLSGSTASISSANQTVLKNSTALMVCDTLTLTPNIVKDSSDDDTKFVYVTASATVKIPIVKRYFTDELKATSAPEFKGD
ncbi:MAG: pilus assembly protein [Selenomonadaceae bacterium]|nr:pilus assembly protein [Selenomonadaceae bacterium]